MSSENAALVWLAAGQEFPAPERAWNRNSQAPGLLAAGGALDTETLRRAYSKGIFPWFSAGQPILWWSPDPRMVLRVSDFQLHRSFRKTLQRFRTNAACEIRIDHSFEQVIRACAASARRGQAGTWIGPSMIAAYVALHRAGLAHSVETWIDGQLAGALYCVALGQALFGESMFSQVSQASKIALAALVALCRHHGIEQIDCQQNTAHLAALGAHEIDRLQFQRDIAAAIIKPAPRWQFDPLYWTELLASTRPPT